MKVQERSYIDKEDLRHMPAPELTRLGVNLLNRQEVVLQCRTCRETWTPQLDSNGKLPFNYWVCPAGCNR